MIVAKIRISGAKADVVFKNIITAGMVGAKVYIDYADPVWDSLRKTVVFSGVETRDVISGDPDVTIPAECVAEPFPFFRVGVYGVDAQNRLVIPTIWANIGPVLNAADPSGDPAADPSLPIWAQIQALIGDPKNLTTQARSNLVEAINEAASTGGASADVILGVYGGYIRYSTDGGRTWENLIALSDLTGPQGAPGKDGTDATVTAESIQAALGYTPADEQKIAKVPEFSGTPAVGQIFKVSAVGEDGKVTMEPVDMQSGGVTDVQVFNESVVADGVANIPVAKGYGSLGLVKVPSVYSGLSVSNGALSCHVYNQEFLTDRKSASVPVTAKYIDLVVKAAMCDGKGPAWTPEEQAAAQERIGIKDATVTAESIQAALGYDPADKEEVGQLTKDLAVVHTALIGVDGLADALMEVVGV